MAVYKDKLYDLKPLRCFDKVIQEERYFLEKFRKDTTKHDFSKDNLNVEYCKEYSLNDNDREIIRYEGDELTKKLQEYTSKQKYLDLEANQDVVVDASKYCFERYDRKAYWGAGDEPPVKDGEATWFMDSCKDGSNEIHRNLDANPVIHEEYTDHYYDEPRLANIHHSTKEETNLKFELCERYKDVMIEGVIEYNSETIKTEAYSDINLVGGNGSVEKPTNVGPIDNCPNKGCL
ncbi:MAG: hypothetical protein GTO02_08770 [Candidatus Dadabacteria bacterium]|nr:hypothetical protein [Candidatus Dadabacteria bacterium]NIQ14478.1 hypothetical protein [Candidatus Dadabacteria bacterium]